jgi:hypothetical protein
MFLSPGFSRIACSIAVVFLSACSTEILKTPIRIPVYDGPLRSIHEVGVLLPAQIVRINKVDGVEVKTFKRADVPFGMAGWEVELVPGTHQLEFDYVLDIPNRQVRSTVPSTITVNIEAGHIYSAYTADDAPKGRWRAALRDVTESERASLAARRGVVSKD